MPKALFTPCHLGRCCTNAIRGNCYVTSHSYTIMGTLRSYCATVGSSNGTSCSIVSKNATNDMELFALARTCRTFKKESHPERKIYSMMLASKVERPGQAGGSFPPPPPTTHNQWGHEFVTPRSLTLCVRPSLWLPVRPCTDRPPLYFPTAVICFICLNSL